MSSPAVDLLRQYLTERRDAGRTHLALSPQSLAALRRLGAPGAGASQPRQPLSAASDAQDAPRPAAARTAPAPVENSPSPAARDESLVLPVTGATSEEKLAALRALAEQGGAARALGTLRDTMVFATGNPRAELMLVGEAPGFQEERQREPFVGPAGEKLTQILKAMGLERGEVYISNICKFRPKIEDNGRPQGTGNRKPTAEEMRACLPYITTEIEIIRPKCIIALGATAAEGLGIMGPVGRLRGSIHAFRGIPTLVTYHPSYLLRQEAEETDGGRSAKRQVWEDMLRAMELLQLPISEKQRAYFR